MSTQIQARSGDLIQSAGRREASQVGALRRAARENGGTQSTSSGGLEAAAVPAQAWLRAALFPAALGVALAVHFLWETDGFTDPDPLYGRLLFAALLAWGGALAAGVLVAGVKSWVSHYGPLFSAGALLVVIWEILTAKAGVLPMPYFPGPDRILSTFRDDLPLIGLSAGHSFRLLVIGYVAGALSGFLAGLSLGWSRHVRYWGQPVLKTLGPIPATAWIPLAMVLFPTSFTAGAFLVALASFFPMTVLTSSGIASVRQSHLDVARMLGATQRQLIWRIAIPSALPTIFVGLFMGLSASFLTLVVAEMVGVKAGLGWYITWAQNYMEYYKVYAALVIMSLFFSGIMTALFKFRDRVLRWQQGLIKW
ncbi:ABC transporter permease [Geminisphaera colitermitum]|uniref:ABC transporter permease n=1 Tax=Geminisphaera colitermitum TaxID=1148786 RepID=UPI000158C6AF|nr:ABC transporter permease [Geminisphaera colitermitum]